MSKKNVFRIVLLFCAFFLNGAPVFSVKTEAAQDPFIDFVNEIYKSTNAIALNNKSSMEVNGKEEYMDDIINVHSRAWKLPKTRIVVSSENGGNYYVQYYSTTDAGVVFPGGIKVGASVKALEKFFDIPQKDSFNEDHYELMDGGAVLFFELDKAKQKIIAIEFSMEGLMPDKIRNFMGFNNR